MTVVYTDGVHLVCSDLAALHGFAFGLGLKRCWFQRSRDFLHYDLTTPSVLKRAVAAGAVPINPRHLVALISGRARTLLGLPDGFVPEEVTLDAALIYQHSACARYWACRPRHRKWLAVT